MTSTTLGDPFAKLRRSRPWRLSRPAGLLATAALLWAGLPGCRVDVVAVDVELVNGEGCNAISLRAVNSLSIEVRTEIDDSACVFEQQCVNVDRSGDDVNPVDTLAELEAQFGDGSLPLLDVPLESAQRVVVLGFFRPDCVVMDENPLLCGQAEPDDAGSNGRLALETDCASLTNARCEGTLVDSCL